ncbi:MAG: hypothetical protein NTZ10_03770 [Candidatus Saganbacteria bacterium]|nr:hypothetical protein [Candidatus Saganbacteria bacterium]
MVLDSINDQLSISSAQAKPGNLSTTSFGFKNLFIYLYDALNKVSMEMADPTTKSIEINGIKLDDKSSAAALFVINRYTSQLESINTMAMDLLTKQGSFQDSVSKLIG